MRPAENIKRSIRNARIVINPEVKKAALKELINKLEKSKITGLAVAGPNVWRTIMKSNITRLSTAAVIIVAAALSVSLWDKAR
jgi:hypothetical protein